MSDDINIRAGKKEDCSAVLELIRELAAYEKALPEVELTAEQLMKDGFESSPPKYQLLVAEENDDIVGCALYYPRYSTWKGRTLYLEDLVVKEAYRRKGVGSGLLKALIGVAGEENAARLEWQVLDWNQDAIAFYEKFNTRFDEEWVNCKLVRGDY